MIVFNLEIKIDKFYSGISHVVDCWGDLGNFIVDYYGTVCDTVGTVFARKCKKVLSL